MTGVLLDRSNLKKKKAYFWQTANGAVHHGGAGLSAGVEVTGHIVSKCSQEAQ